MRGVIHTVDLTVSIKSLLPTVMHKYAYLMCIRRQKNEKETRMATRALASKEKK